MAQPQRETEAPDFIQKRKPEASLVILSKDQDSRR